MTGLPREDRRRRPHWRDRVYAICEWTASLSSPKEKELMSSTEKQIVSLVDDGESGSIDHLRFSDRTLHRQLVAVEADARPGVVLDALNLGAEMSARVSQHGDLESLTKA